MTRSPARAGTIGALWALHLVAAIYARRLSRAIPVATVAHAGPEMSKKFNTGYTRMVLDFNGNGSIADPSGLKPTSLQATSRRKSSHKLRVQASSRSPQAPGSGSQGTSVQAGPGHKQQG